MHLKCLLSLLLSQFILAVRLRPSLPSGFTSTLPPSTHATLTTLSQTYSAPLRIKSDFFFHNVTAGSYLFEVYCHSFFFAPLRVDVHESDESNVVDEVHVWGTFRGNDWDNKGEAVIVSLDGEGEKKNFSFEVQVLAAKKYIMERPGFSPLNLFKNPMIIMASLTMIIVFGMPYLMDNIDPELKAEFEERQKPSSSSSNTPNILQNFDAAAWLAGSSGSSTKS